MKLIDRVLYALAGAALVMGIVLLTVSQTSRQVATGWVCILLAGVAWLAAGIRA